MEKHIPFEKLSPRKKRALNAQRRGGWGGMSPVTRKPANPKAYNRKKASIPGKDRDWGPFSLPLRPMGQGGKIGASHYR